MTPTRRSAGGGYDPWDTIFLAGVTAAPRMLRDDVPFHLRERLNGAASRHRWRFHFVEHHVAHAASAYYPAPFERAAVLTLDGRGECVSTYLGVGDGLQLEKLNEVALPHSLGLLYERVTTHLGFLNSSDEYKVMALASYGTPRYADRFRAHLRWRDDGGYEILPLDLTELVGPGRSPKAPFEAEHFDIASSLQVVLEEAGLQLATWLHAADRRAEPLPGRRRRAELRDELADRARVAVRAGLGPAGRRRCRDVARGGARRLGRTGDRTRGDAARRAGGWSRRTSGRRTTTSRSEAALDHARLTYTRPADLAAAVADHLAQGKVVGWFQGRMEFGPRALGARSILASPTDPAMMQRLNELKDREDFRPVAPAVLAEEAGRVLRRAATTRRSCCSCTTCGPEVADRVPAIRHVDGTARAQTVSREQSPLFHALLERFRERTGVPVLVNTSFNTRGKPIVCTPQDALECFYTSPIDVLAIGSYLLQK